MGPKQSAPSRPVQWKKVRKKPELPVMQSRKMLPSVERYFIKKYGRGRSIGDDLTYYRQFTRLLPRNIADMKSWHARKKTRSSKLNRDLRGYKKLLRSVVLKYRSTTRKGKSV
ncbi:MAG: hypothetical protein ABIE74_03700 [Pseudomonadota bacterium]